MFTPLQAMSRPCYSAINTHATRGRPALVFVPTRKHARLVAFDLLMFAASDTDPNRFRLAEEKVGGSWRRLSETLRWFTCICATH